MGRIDNDPHRRKRQPVCGGDPRHDVRFHVDRSGPGRPVQLPLLRRLSDRRVDADDRGVDRIVDHVEKPARPGGVGGAHRLRFADGGSDDPVSGAQMRGETAGDAEAEHAAVAVADCALRHSGEFASRGSAYNQHAGTGGNAGLEGHADESDDDAALIFDCCTGDFVTCRRRHSPSRLQELPRGNQIGMS